MIIFRKGPLVTLLVGVVLLCTISSCQYSKKTAAKLYKKAAVNQYDMVVIPGIHFQNEEWDWVMRGRIYWAKHLYDQGIAKNIMFSGSAVYSPYVEAEIMALYAEAIGIPKEHIFVETKAEHSTENIFYSYKKSKKLGFEKIALASDPFQTKMLRKFTRRSVSKDVALIPFVIDTMKVIEPTMQNPKIDIAKAKKEGFVSIKERENWWKRLNGTLGRRVDWDAYDSLETGK